MNAKLKPGKYYVGDPYYVLGETTWDRLLDEHDRLQGGKVTVDGHEMFAAGAKYGDGFYLDNYGNGYPVDSGLLAAVPMSLVEKDGEHNEASIVNHAFGKVLEFGDEIECDREDGLFRFGHVLIDTDDDADADLDEDGNWV